MAFGKVDALFTEPKPVRSYSDGKWNGGIFSAAGTQFHNYWGVTVDWGSDMNLATFQYENWQDGNISDLRIIIINEADKTKSGIWKFDVEQEILPNSGMLSVQYGYYPNLIRADDLDGIGDYEVAKAYEVADGDYAGKIYTMTVDDISAGIGVVQFDFLPGHSGVTNFDFGYSAQSFVCVGKLEDAVALQFSSGTGVYTVAGTFTLDDGSNLQSHPNKNIYITNAGVDSGFYRYLGNIYGGVPSFRKIDIKTGDGLFFVKSDQTIYASDNDFS